MANSATTVFPADVCAETRTLSFRSIHDVETYWKGSRSNLYVLAGGSSRLCCEIGTYGKSGGTATYKPVKTLPLPISIGKALSEENIVPDA